MARVKRCSSWKTIRLCDSVISEVLEELGYEVIAASNARPAIPLLQIRSADRPYDL